MTGLRLALAVAVLGAVSLQHAAAWSSSDVAHRHLMGSTATSGRPRVMTELQAKKTKKKRRRPSGNDDKVMSFVEAPTTEGEPVGLVPDQAMLDRWQTKAQQKGSLTLPEPLDIDLPMPNEDSSSDALESGAAGFAASRTAATSGKAGKPLIESQSAGDSIFDLPSVADLESRRKKRQGVTVDTASSSAAANTKKSIDRKDSEALRKRLEIDPQADMMPDIFQKQYDKTTVVTAAVLGEAGQKFLFIEPYYLQAGHLILLLTSLLCANVEFPGNPLTEFPVEVRAFLKSGMSIIFAINTLLAASGAFTAVQKRQPVLLWAVKCFLLGGLAFDQINRAVALPEQPQRQQRKK